MHPVFKQGAGNLHRLTAAATHQVVMVALVSAQTIQGFAVIGADRIYQILLSQRLQIPVDRSQTNLSALLLKLGVNLLGRKKHLAVETRAVGFAVGTPLCDDSGCLGGDPAACIRGDREGGVLDRSISSTITVGGATNAGTFEAAELMVAGMSAREASGVLFEQNLVVADSESTRRRLATATTKHLSFLEDDALRFVANRD